MSTVKIVRENTNTGGRDGVWFRIYWRTRLLLAARQHIGSICYGVRKGNCLASDGCV